MSMMHKAYLFDTDSFNNELYEIIINSGETENVELLKEFITNRIGEVLSVYTGEVLDSDWENELENGDVQELADFAMTIYYSPDEEDGLAYTWDALVEIFKNMPTAFQPDYYILGRAVETELFRLDPGGMGLGFIYAEDIAEMYEELVNLRENIDNAAPPLLDNVLYQSSLPELKEAFDNLISLYKDANEANCGLLMTF